MDPDKQKLEEIYRLTRENNRLLHKMRRGAFWGGIIKFVLYVLVLVVGPLWLYSVYLAPIVEDMMNTYEQIQGTGARANAQLSDLQKMFNSLKQPFSSGE